MLRLDALCPRRIALIKPSALGDVVHALPVLNGLRHRYPGAHITWVVNRAYEPLLRGHPALDETLPFDRGAFRRGAYAAVLGGLRFARQLHTAKFDLVIDLQGLLRTGLMALATGAAVRVGLSSAREGASQCYTHWIEDDRGQHAVDRYWGVVEALGAGDAPKQFNLAIDPAASAWADRQLALLPRPWLVFGIGARWLTKRWPPGHFSDLGRRAAGRFGGSAVFIGTADEAPLAQDCAAGLNVPALDLSGKTTLAQLAAIVARADVVLANDTGPLHVAAALGRPVVAPYTCTEIHRHGPYGAGGAVATSVPCRASYVRHCGHLSCMSDLLPDRLWPALAEALSRWPTLSRPA